MPDTSRKQRLPPTFPTACREDGHAFVQQQRRNHFGGAPVDETFCSRCGITRHAAGYWMSKALKQEVVGQ